MKLIKLLISLFLIIGFAVNLNAQTIGIMTSPPGTITYSMGVAIAKVIQEKQILKHVCNPRQHHHF